MVAGIIYALDKIVYLINLLIFVRVVLSWLNINPYHSISRLIYQLTEPFLVPIRRLLQGYTQGSMFDFTPIIAVFVINGLYQYIIRRLLIGLLF